MRVGPLAKAGFTKLLDFALPARCSGCGTIVDQVHSFCAECWTQIEFLGDSGCSTCGMPLEATEAEECGACLARPPRIQRTRSAVAYDDLSRSIAIRLKYGRKVALARTMARFMAPLVREGEEAILAPVPLHRTRLWSRGFNQSALVAAELGRATGLPAQPRLLRRVKRTPALKGMSLSQRRRVVTGAFRVDPAVNLEGRTVVLVDDVLTTGSTANACARALRRAGAERIELVSWARVVRADATDLKESGSVVRVEIYEKSWCPYCFRARRLLDDKGVDYEVYSLDMGGPLREEMIQRANGRTTVPQIFIDGQHVGGCDDLFALERAGKLEPLLKAA